MLSRLKTLSVQSAVGSCRSFRLRENSHVGKKPMRARAGKKAEIVDVYHPESGRREFRLALAFLSAQV